MRTRIVKWVSIAALLLAAVFWSAAANYQLALNVIVSLAAAVVAVQAVEAKKYRWAASFLVIALLFNPAIPVFGLAGGLSFFLIVLSIAPFALSLAALKPPRLLAVPSITDRSSESESL